MTNIIVLLVIILIITLAISKIISEKRKGSTCIGCSESGKCSSANSLKKFPYVGKKIEIKQIL
jgi:hypothetical protein